MPRMRKSSSAVVLLSSALPARRRCWLFLPMETGSYIAFDEVEGAIFTLLLFNFFDYCLYFMDIFANLFVLSSDGSAFFNGLFVAEDSAVAAFVDKIQRSLTNASFYS